MKNLGRSEWVLVEYGRKRPTTLEEFDGHFYLGTIRLLRCSGNASWVGSERTFKSNRLVSCAPDWVWTHPALMWKEEGQLLEVWGDQTPLCMPLRRAEHISLDYMLWQAALPSLLEQQARALASMGGTQRLQQLESVPGEYLYEHCDWWRLPHLVLAISYLGHVRRLARMETTALVALCHTLRTTPWTLLWEPPAGCPRLRVAGYGRALRDHRLEPELAVQVATKIWADALDVQRERHKHTLFMRAHYNTNFPCLPAAERRALEERCYALLMVQHGMIWVTPERDCFALRADYAEAEHTAVALARIARNAHSECEPVVRGGSDVPVRFGYDQLTAAQRTIFDSAQRHWLTVVSGAPGTGKTALASALFGHWRNALQVGFVGMLVKMVRRRNGKRREVAHTIDYLCTLARVPAKAELAAAWMAEFEVLVVEEISNVNAERFAAVLQLFPRLRKLICVGDYEQLKPLEPGDPMGDLITAYPQRVFRLTENLRVQPALAALQEASPAISVGHPERIRWSAMGPISLVTKGSNADETLYRVLRTVHELDGRYALSHCHIIVLQNRKADGRHALNRAAEEAWTRLGVLRPPQGTGGSRRGIPAHIYVGAKISITKNYNAPIDVGTGQGKWQSDPVVNGDLLIVRAVEKLPGKGLRLTVVDSEDPADDPEERLLWLEAEHGVAPKHVVPGYASTTYKVQGGEFPYVIFWLDSDPGEQWTRPNLYVATSRARLRLWVVGEARDFAVIAKRPEPRRRTVLSRLLHTLPDGNTPLTHYEPTPPTPANDQEVAPADVPVTPTMASVAAEQKRRKDKGKEEADA